MPRDLIKIVGNFQIDRGNAIGKGGFISSVFAGIFNGEKVAVKRVQIIGLNSDDKIELKINQILSRFNHPNIVQFKHYEEDDHFG